MSGLVLTFFVAVTTSNRVTGQVGVIGQAIIRLTDKDGELSNCVCFDWRLCLFCSRYVHILAMDDIGDMGGVAVV